MFRTKPSYIYNVGVRSSYLISDTLARSFWFPVHRTCITSPILFQSSRATNSFDKREFHGLHPIIGITLRSFPPGFSIVQNSRSRSSVLGDIPITWSGPRPSLGGPADTSDRELSPPRGSGMKGFRNLIEESSQFLLLVTDRRL